MGVWGLGRILEGGYFNRGLGFHGSGFGVLGFFGGFERLLWEILLGVLSLCAGWEANPKLLNP